VVLSHVAHSSDLQETPARLARNVGMTVQAARRGLKKLRDKDLLEARPEDNTLGGGLTAKGRAAIVTMREHFARLAAQLTERRASLRLDAAAKTIRRSSKFVLETGGAGDEPSGEAAAAKS
jgi:transposase-like protein